MSVLVVDDDPDVADALRALLEREQGIEVHAAQTLEAGMERLRGLERLDLLICDLRLGTTADDGIDLLRECRRLRPAVRRVLLTGFDRSGLAESGVRPEDAEWIWEKDELFASWREFKDELDALRHEV